MVINVLMEIRLVQRVEFPEHPGAADGSFHPIFEHFDKEMLLEWAIFKHIAVEKRRLLLCWVRKAEFVRN